MAKFPSPAGDREEAAVDPGVDVALDPGIIISGCDLRMREAGSPSAVRGAASSFATYISLPSRLSANVFRSRSAEELAHDLLLRQIEI